jgi:ATP-dependent DNA helicase RecG
VKHVVTDSCGVALDTPVQYLKGVGEGRAALFAVHGVENVRDLLSHFPFRHEDRRRTVRIRELRTTSEAVVIRAKVISTALKTSPVKRMKIFQAMVDDGTGSILCVWFNQGFLAEQIRRNDLLVLYGAPKVDKYGKMQLESPDFEKVAAETGGTEEGSIVPIYPNIGGIQPKAVRKIIEQALPAIASIDEPIPAEILLRLKLPDLRTSMMQLHHPSEVDDDFLAQRSPYHRRMIFGEFFAFQLALRLRRSEEERGDKPHSIRIDDAIRETVRKILPFRLTTAQKRVLKEIAGDMSSPRPMYRLLQGDVGSGKTIVALIASLLAIANGHQAALLAPTEILAEQHYQRIVQLLEGSRLKVAKLSASTTSASRRSTLRLLRNGAIDLLVGTHAILEAGVEFRSFALAIVDEQHRFGVMQRQKLFEKGQMPDALIMTATPIPRSLALATFGDLELSVIDELPPGRRPITTVVRGSAQLPKIYRFLEEQFEEGAQAFFVFPVIEESEKVNLKPLSKGFEELKERFHDRRVAMLHGRMTAEEKDEVMQRFKNREIDLLVTTTVIEVGIDVPNASIMAVVDSDRFGLSQLHQLRGRVGRGSRKSFCILLRDETVSEEAKARLKQFQAARDGFEVAELDLQTRGAGDVLGTRQSGVPKFRFGDFLRDYSMMELARKEAIDYLEANGREATRALATRLMASDLASLTRRD